jgi:hypothetical protein
MGKRADDVSDVCAGHSHRSTNMALQSLFEHLQCDGTLRTVRPNHNCVRRVTPSEMLAQKLAPRERSCGWRSSRLRAIELQMIGHTAKEVGGGVDANRVKKYWLLKGTSTGRTTRPSRLTCPLSRRTRFSLRQPEDKRRQFDRLELAPFCWSGSA